jgi:hypothetical protein
MERIIVVRVKRKPDKIQQKKTEKITYIEKKAKDESKK